MSPSYVQGGVKPYSDFVTVDPSGRYVYVTNHGSNCISQYRIGANGSLTLMSPATVAAGLSPLSIVIVGGYQ
jgi:6-phosphogluconolactonase (cycloisomerase 2 family)